MKRLLLGMSLLFTFLVLACAVPLASLNSGTISGYVFSSNAKVTVEDLDVEVQDSKGTKLAAGKTDKSGHYLITGLPEGDLRVIVSGIMGASGSKGSFGANVKVRAGRIAQVPRINLDTKSAETGFIVRGKVVDSNGAPIYKATIKDVTDRAEDGISTQSLANGTFSLDLGQVSEGQSRKLECSSGGVSQEITLSYFSAGQPVTFTLSLKPLVVTGVVVDQNNLPVEGATVMDVTEGGGESTTTGTDGSFSLQLSNLTNGRTLEVSKGGMATTTSVSESKRTNLRVTLTTTPTTRSLSGTVVDSVTDEGLPGIEVKAGDVSAYTSADGKFTLKGLSFEALTLSFAGTTGYGDKTYYVDAGASNLSNQTYKLDSFGTVIVSYSLENEFVTGSFSNGIREQDNLNYSSLPLVGYVSIEGTNKSQNVTYPATDTKNVTDGSGSVVGTVHLANAIETLIFTEVPSGTRTVSVVLSGKGRQTVNVNVSAGQTSLAEVVFPSTINTGPVNVSGKVVDQNGAAVVGATVTDVTDGLGVSATTIAGGVFTMTLPTLGAGRTLEITNGVLTTTTTVNSSNVNNVLVTLIANARTLTGYVKDATTTNLYLNGAIVRVAGTNISYTSKFDQVSQKDGYFELRGAPVTALSLEVEISGYAKTTSPVLAGVVSPQAVGDIAVNPTGNLRVNYKLYDAWQVLGFPGRAGFACANPLTGDCAAAFAACQGAGYVCAADNFRGLENSVEGFISVEGTSLTQSISYPAAPKIDVKVLGPDGQEQTIGQVKGSNYIQTATFTDVPGGNRSVAIAITGTAVQKSSTVFVPAGDTIATELIILRENVASSPVGDVQGLVRGGDAASRTALDAALALGRVRVSFLRDGESLDLSSNAALAAKLTGADSTAMAPHSLTLVDDPVDGALQAGQFRLANVPVGTRVIIAGVDDGAGNYTVTFIPTSVVVQNVRNGIVNAAPDIIMYSR